MILFYKLLPWCYKWNWKNYMDMYEFYKCFCWFSSSFPFYLMSWASSFWLHFRLRYFLYHSFVSGPQITHLASEIWQHDWTIFQVYIPYIRFQNSSETTDIWIMALKNVSIFRTIKIFWDNKVSERSVLQKCWIQSLGKMFLHLHESGAGRERWANQRRHKKYGEVEVNRG